MQFAIRDNEKIEAKPKTRAFCQLCDQEVISKCGEVNIWHWAHHKNESCDGWFEPETCWHRNWKLIFGIENSEVVIKKEGIRHIADIFSINEVVIELQNSPIQKQVIRKRENFYGERMLWLINGASFVQNFSTWPRGIPLHWERTSKGWVNYLTGEIRPLWDELKTNEHDFYWNWARKSWCNVQRPVFIDFGGDKLFWVKEGMGTSIGVGVNIKKESFILKYKGFLDQIKLVI